MAARDTITLHGDSYKKRSWRGKFQKGLGERLGSAVTFLKAPLAGNLFILAQIVLIRTLHI